MENQESIYEEKQGNLLTGILGACLGALIGTALWVLVGFRSMARRLKSMCKACSWSRTSKRRS